MGFEFLQNTQGITENDYIVILFCNDIAKASLNAILSAVKMDARLLILFLTNVFNLWEGQVVPTELAPMILLPSVYIAIAFSCRIELLKIGLGFSA